MLQLHEVIWITLAVLSNILISSATESGDETTTPLYATDSTTSLNISRDIWYSFGNYEYKISLPAVHLKYDESENICVKENGTLAQVKSEEIHNFIHNLVQVCRDMEKCFPHSFWIGLTKQNGEFIWNDGSILDYKHWHSEYPKNKNDTFCVAMGWTYYYESNLPWRDFPCDVGGSGKKGYVCQRTIGKTNEVTTNINQEKSSTVTEEISPYTNNEYLTSPLPTLKTIYVINHTTNTENNTEQHWTTTILESNAETKTELPYIEIAIGVVVFIAAAVFIVIFGRSYVKRKQKETKNIIELAINDADNTNTIEHNLNTIDEMKLSDLVKSVDKVDSESHIENDNDVSKRQNIDRESELNTEDTYTAMTPHTPAPLVEKVVPTTTAPEETYQVMGSANKEEITKDSRPAIAEGEYTMMSCGSDNQNKTLKNINLPTEPSAINKTSVVYATMSKNKEMSGKSITIPLHKANDTYSEIEGKTSENVERKLPPVPVVLGDPSFNLSFKSSQEELNDTYSEIPGKIAQNNVDESQNDLYAEVQSFSVGPKAVAEAEKEYSGIEDIGDIVKNKENVKHNAAPSGDMYAVVLPKSL